MFEPMTLGLRDGGSNIRLPRLEGSKNYFRKIHHVFVTESVAIFVKSAKRYISDLIWSTSATAHSSRLMHVTSRVFTKFCILSHNEVGVHGFFIFIGIFTFLLKEFLF